MSPPNDPTRNPPPSKPIGNDGTVFRCPMCNTILPNINIATFPFCCDRCRLLDLNNWMTGKYTASRPIDPSDELADLPRKVPPPSKPEE
jgi:endogenous inhibitor of DNA gyrase (YacG/DUF329 family)